MDAVEVVVGAGINGREGTEVPVAAIGSVAGVFCFLGAITTAVEGRMLRGELGNG